LVIDHGPFTFSSINFSKVVVAKVGVEFGMLLEFIAEGKITGLGIVRLLMTAAVLLEVDQLLGLSNLEFPFSGDLLLETMDWEVSLGELDSAGQQGDDK